jgi:hypothetical protein
MIMATAKLLRWVVANHPGDEAGNHHAQANEEPALPA